MPSPDRILPPSDNQMPVHIPPIQLTDPEKMGYVLQSVHVNAEIEVLKTIVKAGIAASSQSSLKATTQKNEPGAMIKTEINSYQLLLHFLTENLTSDPEATAKLAKLKEQLGNLQNNYASKGQFTPSMSK